MAEGGGLLNRYRVKSSIGGSNPPLSARYHVRIAGAFSLQVRMSLGMSYLTIFEIKTGLPSKPYPKIQMSPCCGLRAGGRRIFEVSLSPS